MDERGEELAVSVTVFRMNGVRRLQKLYGGDRAATRRQASRL